MKVMLTGHRPGTKLNQPEAFEGMTRLLLHLWQETEDDLIVISGGADGADRLWARAAAHLQTPFYVYVPRGYYEHYKLVGWPTRLLAAAEEIHWTQPEGIKFNPKFNHIRNTQMIDAADRHVVCALVSPEDLLKTKRGGTRHATGVIMERNLRPYWINSLTGDWARP